MVSLSALTPTGCLVAFQKIAYHTAFEWEGIVETHVYPLSASHQILHRGLILVDEDQLSTPHGRPCTRNIGYYRCTRKGGGNPLQSLVMCSTLYSI